MSNRELGIDLPLVSTAPCAWSVGPTSLTSHIP